jgi:L-asparagine transporter-like permease
MAPHGQIGFGPGLYLFSATFIVIALLGVWMMIDTTRTKRRLRKEQEQIPREPLSFYALCGGLYTALFLVMVIFLILGAQQTFTMLVLFTAPLMIIVELAYLLRVVYPKPRKEKP